MANYQLKRVQTLPLSIEKLWDFFSHPNNLQVITHPDVKFIQLTKLQDDEAMYPGMIIRYKFAPFLGIFFKWETEITEVKERDYFIDSQKSGPFAMWQHRHSFKSVAEGTEMTDFLEYRPPYGFLGTMAHGMFLRKQLETVFDFRFKKLEELFGKVQPKNN
ncbi:MAG: SRPBCC family protein [Bacteroidia bacterium]|nr:SRPBCC family protein [Bacteroidia bacterium]